MRQDVPGRKSDSNDARWIADLLALWLIRSRSIAPAIIRALQDFTRTGGVCHTVPVALLKVVASSLVTRRHLSRGVFHVRLRPSERADGGEGVRQVQIVGFLGNISGGLPVKHL
ncbi:MAG: hypothetical protein U0Q11_04550 [Vicinamibacterales bacterium]